MIAGIDFILIALLIASIATLAKAVILIVKGVRRRHRKQIAFGCVLVLFGLALLLAAYWRLLEADWTINVGIY
jgi:uncharacterized membrane protein YidH (DUF202 family)